MQSLTSREEEVARLVANGHSNQEIGEELQIALQTVKNHIQSVFRKLAFANRVELALRFEKNRRSVAFQRDGKNRQSPRRESA